MAGVKVTQRVQVVESERQFGQKSFTPFDDDTPLASGDDAARIASIISRIRSKPDVQLRTLQVTLTNAPAELVAAVYTTDFNDLIEVNVDLPGGQFKLDRNVQGVRHRFRLGYADTQFRTGTPVLTRFILGSDTFGVLGTSTL